MQKKTNYRSSLTKTDTILSEVALWCDIHEIPIGTKSVMKYGKRHFTEVYPMLNKRQRFSKRTYILAGMVVGALITLASLVLTGSLDRMFK